MKTQFSSIELIRVVKELKERILNGKINQVYVNFDREKATKKEILIELYVPNKGKQLLYLLFPSLLYLPTQKPKMPEKPDGYCLYLRKWLKNARIKDIAQLGTERILKMTIEGRDPTKTEFTPFVYHAYIELFSKGNFILCNKEDIILSPLELQEWSDRVVKPQVPYTHPKQEYNVFKISEKDFEKALDLSMKENIVKTLALSLGIGGIYAEELCLRASLSKDATKITSVEKKKLFEYWKILLEEVENSQAYVIKEEGVLIDVFPCLMQNYKEKSESCQSYFDGLEQSVGVFTVEKTTKPLLSKHDKDIEKLQTMVRMQKLQLENFEKEYKENQKKGEYVYENYQKIDEIFNQLQNAKKIKSWDEIKATIKNSKIIKKIDEKDKEIVLEL